MSKSRIHWLVLAALIAPACGDDDPAPGASCDAETCDAQCQADGYQGGLCEDDGSCTCVGGDADTDADSDADSDSDVDSDSDGDTDGFQPTPGTQAAVDRTEPCDPSVDIEPKYAPQDGATVRYCFPNYNIWAPLECGNNPWDLPGECDQAGCSGAVCLTGEAAKWISDGSESGVCACFNMCAAQEDGATCGASGERPCIPIDDAGGAQVFICGANL